MGLEMRPSAFISSLPTSHSLLRDDALFTGCKGCVSKRSVFPLQSRTQRRQRYFRVSCEGQSVEQEERERSSSSVAIIAKGLYEVRDWNFKSFRVQYAVAGDDGPEACLRPALVLVHGFGANCQHWRNNLSPLADNAWRVYALDLLGFGMGDKPAPGTLDSDGDPVAYNFDYWTAELVQFIEEVVHAREKRPVFLVANSIGAMVVMQASAQKPELCAAQVFISPSLRQLNVRKRSWIQDITAPILMQVLNYRPLGAYFLNSLRKPEQLREVLQKAYYNLEAVDDQLVKILSEPAYTDGALDVFLAFIMYDDGPIPEDFLPVLTKPALVIWGEEDRFEPYELGEALRHYSIVDEFVSFPGIGHCAHDEMPEECNKLISAFVKKNMHRAELPPS